MKNFNVYIGYDERERVAAEVCNYSILKNGDQMCPPLVKYLKSENIPQFVREREPNQSTDFTYTRFMIPFLENYKGYSVFCDCDFLFTTNIIDLLSIIDPTKAVSVVKHPPYVPHTQSKMDGIPQHTMPRKNWASLIVFNNEHSANKALTPEYVNTVMPGRTLHQFGWLEDDQIGSIPLEWNTLDDYYLLENPKAIHYTDGGPWFYNYKDTMYSSVWLQYYNELNLQRHIL